MKTLVALFIILAGLYPLGAESLWSPGFKGYVTSRGVLTKGDTVVVVIDSSSNLTFSASSSDSKTLTLEFSGGAGGNLFSFLPQGKTGGETNLKGAEQYSFRGQIAASVTDVDPTGRGLIQGTRTITIQGKEESVTVSGSVNPKDVDQNGEVPLSRVADAKLLFRTFVEPSQPVLSDQDIQQLISAAAAAATPTPATTGGPGAVTPATPATVAPAGAPATSTTPTAPAGTSALPASTATTGAAAAPSTTLTLSDAKKRELLLTYLNRLIDIIFSQ